ncbi:MAG: DegT/DnrJ/EryC1/StrS family aminotransferase [Candidatus Methylomirabilales bacterium]
MNYERSLEHPLTIACPYFPPEEQARLQRELIDILNNQLSMGPRVEKFEQEFAAYCGAAQGIAFPNCTASLETALLALGVEPGDEILVPVETFIATGMAVHLVGALSVFTEISAETFAMDFEDAWLRVTERTRGAIVVHFGGMIPSEFPDFVKRMHSTGRFVIEDAAHAHGAELNGRRAGSLADAGCFSFYPTKIMTTGEGGMLVTLREDVAQTARSLQNRGLDVGNKDERYVLPGRNNRFTEIAAAMGLSQLRCLSDFIERRRRIASIYEKGLTENELFRPILPGRGSRPSYWRYVVVPMVPLNRVALKQALTSDKIVIDWAYDPPLHLQPVFQRLMGTHPGMLPRSEELLSRHICLPVHALMQDIDAEYVVERLLFHASRLISGRR